MNMNWMQHAKQRIEQVSLANETPPGVSVPTKASLDPFPQPEAAPTCDKTIDDRDTLLADLEWLHRALEMLTDAKLSETSLSELIALRHTLKGDLYEKVVKPAMQEPELKIPETFFRLWEQGYGDHPVTPEDLQAQVKGAGYTLSPSEVVSDLSDLAYLFGYEVRTVAAGKYQLKPFTVETEACACEEEPTAPSVHQFLEACFAKFGESAFYVDQALAVANDLGVNLSHPARREVDVLKEKLITQAGKSTSSFQLHHVTDDMFKLTRKTREVL